MTLGNAEMTSTRFTAADMVWQEKADLNASAFGAVVAVIAAAFPLFLM